jgi:hypothetical protein
VFGKLQLTIFRVYIDGLQKPNCSLEDGGNTFLRNVCGNQQIATVSEARSLLFGRTPIMGFGGINIPISA